MKKRILLICIAISICVLAISQKKFNNSQFTLISYVCSVDARIDKELSNFDAYINCTPPKGTDKVITMMTHSVFSMVKDRLETMLNIYMPPVNSFQDYAKYDAFGYPDILIQKAIKKGDSKYYLKIIANIETETGLPSNSNNADLKPQIKVTLEIYSKEGYVPVKVAEGVSAATSPLSNEPGVITNLNFVKLPDDKKLQDVNSIKILILEAIDAAITKLQY